MQEHAETTTRSQAVVFSQVVLDNNVGNASLKTTLDLWCFHNKRKHRLKTNSITLHYATFIKNIHKTQVHPCCAANFIWKCIVALEISAYMSLQFH